MNPIVPIQYYVPFYYNLLIALTLIVFMQSQGSLLESPNNLKGKNGFGLLFFIFLLLYIGLRPVSFRFGDMMIYNLEFESYLRGESPAYKKDVLFEFFQYKMSKLRSATFFFFVCEFLYIYPLFQFSRKVFKEYWFYAFYMLVISMSFWSFGTNGLRNGIATSLFLYAVSRNNKVFTFIILFSSLFIHKSVALPIICYIGTFFYNKPKSFLYFWFLTIPLSLALGASFQSFFLNLGIIDDNSISAYLGNFDALNEGVQIKVGFRWDFLLYSATGVFAGWYYIFKKKFEDKFYTQLYNIYLMVNGFWVLIIRANYSNRFAYLSWFMLGVIIIYPLLKNKIYTDQHKVIGVIILGYYALTYLLNMILV